MNVTGKVYIFVNESKKGTYYTASISSYDKREERYNNYSALAYFNGIEPPAQSQLIEIADGFAAVYNNKEGVPQLKLVINDYDTESSTQKKRAVPPTKSKGRR